MKRVLNLDVLENELGRPLSTGNIVILTSVEYMGRVYKITFLDREKNRVILED